MLKENVMYLINQNMVSLLFVVFIKLSFSFYYIYLRWSEKKFNLS